MLIFTQCIGTVETIPPAIEQLSKNMGTRASASPFIFYELQHALCSLYPNKVVSRKEGLGPGRVSLQYRARTTTSGSETPLLFVIFKFIIVAG